MFPWRRYTTRHSERNLPGLLTWPRKPSGSSQVGSDLSLGSILYAYNHFLYVHSTMYIVESCAYNNYALSFSNIIIVYYLLLERLCRGQSQVILHCFCSFRIVRVLPVHSITSATRKQFKEVDLVSELSIVFH